jgi:hypothetical protein
VRFADGCWLPAPTVSPAGLSRWARQLGTAPWSPAVREWHEATRSTCWADCSCRPSWWPGGSTPCSRCILGYTGFPAPPSRSTGPAHDVGPRASAAGTSRVRG